MLKEPEKLRALIEDKVIPPFRKWAHNAKSGGEQFAVLMLMDKNGDWDKFQFNPTPTKTYEPKHLVKPSADPDEINNYILLQYYQEKWTVKKVKSIPSSVFTMIISIR